MTAVSWLLDDDVFGEEAVGRLAEEIRRQGMRVEFTRHKPFADLHGERPWLDLFGPDECVVFYGSINLALQVRRHAKWIPGVYLDPERVACRFYYPRFRKEDLLNSPFAMLPFGSLIDQKFHLFELFRQVGGGPDALFVRPDAGLKHFTGGPVRRAEWAKEIELLGTYGMRKEDLVLVAPVLPLRDEYRVVVVDKKAAAASFYRRGRDIVEEPAPAWVLDEAQQILDRNPETYQFGPAWVMDVCNLEDMSEADLFVVEVNSFSCSGLYACPLEPVVKAVSQAAASEYNEYHLLYDEPEGEP